MMRRNHVLGALLLLGVLASAGALYLSASQQSADELYEAALLKKEAEGDLNGAIMLFQKIIKTFPRNRELGAKAQLQIGMCYEKLGLEQAREAFRKVVEDYPEQTREVTTAREKLSVLLSARTLIEKGVGDVRIRKVWDNALDWTFSGAPSPDGRYVSYVDWMRFANLGIHDLATGEARLLTDNSSWDHPQFAYQSVFSPEGRHIAFAWQTKEGLIQLRTISADGSSLRVLNDGRDLSYQFPACWSYDGKRILTVLYPKDSTPRIVFIAVTDGSVEDVASLDLPSAASTRLSLSPDGSLIACSFPPQKGRGNSDVYLLSVEGKSVAKIVEHPADDVVLGWSPDGGRVLFTSDRTGSTGVWTIRVADKEAKGIPELVRGDMGNIRPLGMTRDGDLFYGLHFGWSDVFAAGIDPVSGTVMSPPAKAIRKYESFNSAPYWSPDGRFLVCLSTRGRMITEIPVLLISELRTGEIRELSPNVNGGLRPDSIRLSPDGQSVLGVGVDDKGTFGALYMIDFRSGNAKILTRSGGLPIISPEWTPDGKSICYVKFGNEFHGVIKFDATTRTETELYRFRQGAGSITLRVSPDGSRLALGEGERIHILSLDGTESHDPFQVKGLATLAWSPDGRFIVYGKQSGAGDDIRSLWRIPVAGGEPQGLGLSMSRLTHLSIHPDGRQIAFTGSEQPGKTEVWVMEGFLGKEK